MVQLCFAIFMASQAVASWQAHPIKYVGFASGQNVTVCIDGSEVKHTAAGKMGFTDGWRTWYSVCAAVRSPVSDGQVYRVRSWRTSVLGSNYAKAGRIVARYFNEARSPAQCAGLQLAVWEAIEDGGPVADFGHGRFQAQGTPAAMAFADQYYLAIGDEGQGVYLQTGDDGGQGQISTTN